MKKANLRSAGIGTLFFFVMGLPGNEIYEICDRLGYIDQDHFRESFKKQFGLTPTEYRNKFL